MKNCLPGFFTMWNDVAGRGSPEASTKGNQGIIKRAPTLITSGPPSTSPSLDHAPFTPINTTNS